MKKTTAQPAAPSNKEVLNITGGKWESFTNKNGKNNRAIYVNGEPILFIQSKHIDKSTAIVTAVNETYGKGYNPAAMDELYKALKEMIEFAKIVERHTEHKCHWLAAAETALRNAKTIKP